MSSFIQLLSNYADVVYAVLVGSFIGYFFNEIKSKRERRRNNDKETLQALDDILNKDGLIICIRDRDMMGSHLSIIHGYMDTFHEFCNDPRNTFVDNKLKQYQKQLSELINNFNHYLASSGSVGASIAINKKEK